MDKRPVPNTMKYLFHMPRKIPEGKVVVHNRVKPASPIGTNGFRIWLQSPSDDPMLVVCNCGWAPHLKSHYRVFGVGAATDPKPPSKSRWAR
jgi:hypothetical protein